MKKYIMFMLICVFAIFGYSMANDMESVIENFSLEKAEAKIDTLNNDIEYLVEKLESLDAEKMKYDKEITAEYKEVRQEIVSVIQEITQTKKNIEETIKNIDNYKSQIILYYKNLSETRLDIETTKENLEDFALFLYKIENETATKWDFDLVKAFIKSDNMAITAVNEDIIETVTMELNSILSQLASKEQRESQVLDKLIELKNSTYNEIEDYNLMLNKQMKKREYLSQFIEMYKDWVESQRNFQNIFDNWKELHFAIKDIVTEISLKQYWDDVKIKLDEVKESEIISNKVHPIGWPIYPAEEIVTYFKDSDFENYNWYPQLGIDIQSSYNGPVYSSKDGIVYKVSKWNIFEINWLVIIHADNYVSVYSYLNDILLEEWDIVSRWELIGYAGGAGDDLQFVSESANINYMIFKDWVALDPLTILDLSVIKNNIDIPKDYKIKYLNDKHSREIDMTALSFMEGDTIDERAQIFLNKHAVWVYNTVEFRDKVVEGTNVDRDMLICIWFAESTLWQYLSTSNNIGNVGNDDSGNRIAYDSPILWARLIADTLNNKHLGDYHTVLDLSRYGNDDGMIYASSPINRQTNVTKCLSMIKGYYVPDEFPFRTWPNPRKN